MENFLSLLPDKVKKGVKVVTAAELGMDHLLHISTNGKIKEFIPFITQRSVDSEDRSVPRVCTAPTLLGCLIGYGIASDDFLNPPESRDSYKGGWYIYGLPFEKAIKPAPSLLEDQRCGDEHWLVTYNTDTRVYAPVMIGKCFYKEITALGVSNDIPIRRVKMLVEIAADIPVKLGASITLTKGYWEIEGDEPVLKSDSWKNDKAYTVTEIDKETYNGSKKLSADLLSFSNPVKLTSFNW